MKRLNWQIVLGLSLIALSALIYLIHFAIFRDAHHIFIYMVGDIAFVPIEVLMVTLIIHRLLTEREKRSMLKKLNMVIGAFFSEVGTHLLKSLYDFDAHAETIRKDLIVRNKWSKKDYSRILKHLAGYDYSIDSGRSDLVALKSFLLEKRHFLLGLLENPNLLEHESFSELLWAVFHLTEELATRKDFKDDPIAKEVMFFSAPQSEISHLTDIYLDSKSDMPMNSNETTQWSDIWDD